MFSNGKGLVKIAVVFGTDLSSFVPIDNKKKNIMILNKNPTDDLDGTTFTAKKKKILYFTEQKNKFWLILHDFGGE